jgi:hypothetical protein
LFDNIYTFSKQGRIRRRTFIRIGRTSSSFITAITLDNEHIASSVRRSFLSSRSSKPETENKLIENLSFLIYMTLLNDARMVVGKPLSS